MKTVLFVYRVLLPPLLLFRFCLASPLGAESNPQIKASFQPHLGGSGAQHNLDELLFGMDDTHRDGNIVLVQDLVTPEKVMKETWVLKPNPESSKKTTQFSFNPITNFSVSSQEEAHTRWDFRLSSRRFGHHNFNNLTRQRKVKTVISHLPLTKDETKKKFGTKKISVHFNGELSNTRFQLPLISKSHSSGKHGSGHIVRHRARRALIETTPSNRVKHSSPRQIPPEYMIRLFQLLSGTHYQMMRNVVVTGFVNINDEEDYLEGSGSTLHQAHQLVFDVSFRHEAETMQYAELRLHVSLKSRETGTEYINETIIDIMSQSHDISIFEIDPYYGHRLIAFTNIGNAHRTWVSFNITSSVQQWEYSGLRVLEARVSVSENRTEADGESIEDFDTNIVADYVLDIDTEQGKEPLLVVFSKKSEADDQATHHIQKRDAMKERTNEINSSNSFPYIYKDFLTSEENWEGLVKLISAVDIDSSNQLSNKRVNVSQNSQSAFSNDYPKNDTEKNTLYRNIDNRTFLKYISRRHRVPKNFIMDQTSNAHANRTQKTRPVNVHVHRKSTFLTTQFSNKNNLRSTPETHKKIKLSEDLIRLRVRRDTKSRYRRHLDSLFNEQPMSGNGSRFKRSKKKRNSCQRGELYVDFETIKWDKVIIFPRGYQAFECTGKCFTPISEYLTPTKHAIIQTLVHTSYPSQASRACCVPTKLEPISILYWDENGDIKYDYSYEGMVVAECGCR